MTPELIRSLEALASLKRLRLFILPALALSSRILNRRLQVLYCLCTSKSSFLKGRARLARLNTAPALIKW